MAEGFTQCYGIDYEETFTFVERKDIIRFFLSMIASKGWKKDHVDIKSIFPYNFFIYVFEELEDMKWVFKNINECFIG